MRKPSKILLLVLLLLMGSTSYADARSGHGGRHGGFHEGGMVDSAVEVLGIIISSRTTGLGMSTASIPIFMGG